MSRKIFLKEGKVELRKLIKSMEDIYNINFSSCQKDPLLEYIIQNY